jgi:hypothetical protein
MHDEFPLALFLPLASDVNKFSLLCREAGPSPPRPGFDTGYIFGLDFSQILFGAPANSPAKIVVDEGRSSTLGIHWLVD